MNATNKPLTRLREFLAISLILLCIAQITLQALERSRASTLGPEVVHSKATALEQYGQKSFLLMSKVAYAGSEYLRKLAEDNPALDDARRTFVEGFTTLLKEEVSSPMAREERLLMATSLELPNVQKHLCEDAITHGDPTARYAPYCNEVPGKDSRHIESFENTLPLSDSWFTSLRLTLKSKPLLHQNPSYQEAKRSTVKVLAWSATLSIGFALSSFCFLLLLSKARRGALRLHYQPQHHIGVALLECFSLYLGGMVVLPELAQQLDALQSTAGMLLFNAVGISLLAGLYFWPRFRDSTATQHAFGLPRSSFSELISDFFTGPFAYFSFLSALFCVLLVYSVLLQALGIDPSSGSHPIIPMLRNEKSSTIWLLTFLLAVVVAPIVEELLFRGALYGWLRTRASAFSAIVLSALLFAVVHPQGALGLVPLTCIGMLLAFLREWRKTLLSPILAHACVNGVTLLIARTIV